MKKFSLSVAIAAAASMVSMAAQAAPNVVYADPIFTGGQSFEYSISTSCLKTGSDPKSVAGSVTSCFIAAMQKAAPAGNTITGNYTNWSGGPANFSYLIKFVTTYKGKVVNSQQSGAQIVGSCPTGYSFTSNYKQCQKVESATACVERLDYPSRVVLSKAIDACKGVETQRTTDGLKQMEGIRLKGAAARAVLAGIVYALDKSSRFAIPFDAASGYTWNSWVNATEDWLKGYYHNLEQGCENHERQNYRDRLIGIKKTCGAPL